MPITHAFTSAKADGDDATLVRPSDWNADHELSDPATLPRASYSGDPVSIANGANAWLTWDSLGFGDALLDLTDPAHPTAVAAGIYSVTVVAMLNGVLTAGGSFEVQLHVDATGDDAVCEMSNGDTGDGRTLTSLNVTFYVPVGGVIDARVYNFDGAASRDFNLREAMIQKIA